MIIVEAANCSLDNKYIQIFFLLSFFVSFGWNAFVSNRLIIETLLCVEKMYQDMKSVYSADSFSSVTVCYCKFFVVRTYVVDTTFLSEHIVK